VPNVAGAHRDGLSRAARELTKLIASEVRMGRGLDNSWEVRAGRNDPLLRPDRDEVVQRVRRVTRVSNEITMHLLETDVFPVPCSGDLSRDPLSSLSIVLEAIGGRVEARLKRDQPTRHGPFTMSFVPPGAQMWAHTTGVRRLRELRLEFDVARVSKALGETLAAAPGPTLLRSDRLRHLAFCLAAECETRDRFSTLYVDGLTVAACIDFLRLGRAESTRPLGGLTPRHLRRVTEYIAEHLSEAVTLKELAELTGLSQSHFRRAFKASTGLAPHRWHLEARIEEAQRLLGAGDMTQAEIALATGFAGQSHFCRMFKSVIGVTPGAWVRERS
jgi:AraC family transcriptional regulator